MPNYQANLQGLNDYHPIKGVLGEWEISEGYIGQVQSDIAKECGVFDLRINPSVVYLLVAPSMLMWSHIEWYLLEVKRKEGNKKAHFNGLQCV